METLFVWDTEELSNEFWNSVRDYEDRLWDEEDPNPQATLEQDHEYILMDILLEDIRKFRATLSPELTDLERADILLYYVRWGVTSFDEYRALPMERRLYGSAHLPLERREYMTKEEFQALEEDFERRRKIARERHERNKNNL